ncbi:MAG: VOC family protein [Acetobacteraceae bacterium]
MTGLVTHFEIYAEEPATLAEFYRQLFGWELERVPGLDYWRIEAGAAPVGSVSGGLTYRPIAGTRGWVHYVHVKSLDDAVTEAEQLGAVVLRPKAAVPKTAWYAVLADPEGNIFAIYQTDPAAFPPPEPNRGSGNVLPASLKR